VIVIITAILLTNELSASGIVALCSKQKSINVSHEKIDIKIEIAIFFFQKSNQNQSKIKNGES